MCFQKIILKNICLFLNTYNIILIFSKKLFLFVNLIFFYVFHNKKKNVFLLFFSLFSLFFKIENGFKKHKQDMPFDFFCC